MGLKKRSISSALYNVASQGFRAVVLLIRSVGLARILQPEVFGIYAFSQAIVSITLTLPSFGLGSAYTHRSPESEHPEAINVYFTLTLLFALAWAAGLTALGAALLERQRFLALVVLIVSACMSQASVPAQTSLSRQVRFGRLAILRIVSVIATTVMALYLAASGVGIWSLLAIDLANAVILLMGLYVVDPVWRPKLVWSPPIVRYFLKFGSSITVASTLVQILDRLDDVWTGHFLGNEALGFYSRAYSFANYPQRVVANPITTVAFPTYAEVSDDKRLLSRAFFRVNALIVRLIFPFGSILFLISPEFVRLLLGEQWLPMLRAFQLMIAYTLLDPIKHSVGHLFVSTGSPAVLTRTRLIQLLVLISGLAALGPTFGIEGVALAVTIMSVAGVGGLLRRSRQYVDFSLTRLFAVPAVASLLGILIGMGGTHVLARRATDWLVAGMKIGSFALTYGLVILVMERSSVRDLYAFLRESIPGSG